MRFSTLGFFHKSVSPGANEYPIGLFRIFSKIRGDNCEWTLSGVPMTPAIKAKKFRGIIFFHTGNKFFAGVIGTSDKHSFVNISANFWKHSKRPQWNTWGAWGTLIHEKNLKSKISCQTPYKKINIKVLAYLQAYLPSLFKCLLTVLLFFFFASTSSPYNNLILKRNCIFYYN